ncbi:ribokinase [Sporosarcina sp. P37]|uniref:ribokinase n=1 Tax=unclassified Sporosarcina TaxID=2647733 RepID=UPI0009BCBD42|nr:MULTISPECIES: ribokinase [unclassified Sporosarcina]ARD48896.1 ribokinase [Sporosarcina sp. P33]ARK25395.1 ribokinase [Sporosarcina sp. P37]PID19052.1 ribokinase [Sporosarcina sp. P35]
MITVIGSANMDLVVGTENFPDQGETVLGNVFDTVPGGKGANQAIAAARLGSETNMVACVGSDLFGTSIVNNMQQNHVNTAGVRTEEGASGIANILLSEGDNRIIVVPGANSLLMPAHIDEVEDVIKRSKLVMLQLEIPIPTVIYTLAKCQAIGIPVLLNPAPARGFELDMMPSISYLTPNETECEQIFGMNMTDALEKYPNRLIITLGKDGARYFDGERHVIVEGFPTKAVDTTGAGDTFNGAFAHAIVAGMELEKAVRFANAAASLSVEKFGAQGGMPSAEEVAARLEEMK